MKILHIFGAVVAVHLAVFLIIFAVPGCRSTGRQQAGDGAESSPASTDTSDASGAISPAPANLEPALNPAPPSVPASTTVRFTPTRPSGSTGGAPATTQALAEPTSTSTYTVVKGDSLWTVAKKHGVTVNELASANNLRSNTVLQLGQRLIVPAKATARTSAGTAATAPAGATAPAPDAGGASYTVRSGDSLVAIAKAHATTPATLRALNNLRSDTVRVGQVLTLPTGVSVAEEPVTANRPSAQPPRSSGGGGYKHTVAPGETLGAIARKYEISVGELATANQIANPTKIRPGQELTIPGWSPTRTPRNNSAPAPAAANRPAATPPAQQQRPAPEPVVEVSPIAPAQSSDVPVIRIEENPAPIAPSGAPLVR